jgi:NAD(P)H-dependent FMN reductase
MGAKIMKLAVIVGSTRQGRQTLKQAKWVAKTAAKIDGVEVSVLDLADYPMPFFEEAASPRYNPNREIHEVAKKWLNDLAAADAYVVVTPEYNHSIPGVLKNAFDYLDWQLVKKPAAIVSHGSVGGARAAMHLKEILSEGKAVPIPSFVAFHGVSEDISDEGAVSDGLLANPYGPQGALDGLLTELKWYSDALAEARSKDQ